MTTTSFEPSSIPISAGATQLAVLRNLRNKLIGNDEEKLIQSKGETIPTLLRIIDDAHSKQQACRVEASILICSLSFGKKATWKLILC